MTSIIEYHYQTIGRIIVHLVEKGLMRVDLESSDVFDIMTERWGDEDVVIQTFADVVHWMNDEGIIRIRTVQGFDHGFCFSGVQLTAKGLAIIGVRQESNGDSIKKIVESKPGLDSAAYGKIGELVGGLLGGFTKSMAGG
jgi:hypothetical protein